MQSRQAKAAMAVSDHLLLVSHTLHEQEKTTEGSKFIKIKQGNGRDNQRDYVEPLGKPSHKGRC